MSKVNQEDKPLTQKIDLTSGEDYVMTYHEGDVEGIAEGEYWVVSVQRRRLDAMAELADEFVYAGA